MLKQGILYSLLTLTLLNAGSVKSGIGINVGMTSTKNETKSKFENPTIGITYQDNSYVVMPRVDMEYVKLKNEQADSLLKGSVNGVYEFENRTNTTPYAVAGIGYESVSGATKNVFESHPFIHGGAGINIDIQQEYKINLEGKYLQVMGGHNEENELILTAGIVIPLGVKKVVKKVIEPRILLPILIPTPSDMDKDGVEDNIDQCPYTPLNFIVDTYGCSVKATLKINFRTNSAEITEQSMPKVEKFAKFLLRNNGSMVKIFGHTDNVGTANSNLLLSEKRAKSVARALVTRGVNPLRLYSEGKGENQPIASNNTESGKAMNRRIEAELSYPRGRR